MDNIILIGMPAVGKSTVGVIVAKRHIHMTPEDAEAAGTRGSEVADAVPDGYGLGS